MGKDFLWFPKMILLIFTEGKQKEIHTTDGHTIQILIHSVLGGEGVWPDVD